MESANTSNTNQKLKPFEGCRCLVTGHTGFKGSWLSLWLHSLGAKITGYALDPPTSPNLFTLAGLADLVEDFRGDIRDYDRLKTLVKQAQPEIVFHMAAQPIVRQSYDDPKYTFDVNVGGTVNLLDVLRDCRTVQAVVVITTDKCYENREWEHAYRETDRLGGHDPYSASKAAAEIAAAAYARSFFREAGVNLATVRAGNVIGGGDWAIDRIIPDAVEALRKGEKIPVRNPKSIRPWQHVLEPLFGYLLLGSRLLDGSAGPEISSTGAWNFGPSPTSCRTVEELVETLISVYGSGEWENFSSGQENGLHEAKFLALAWDKAYRYLGWYPRLSFDETVRNTGNWYRNLADGASARQLCLDDIKSYLESA